MFRVPHKLEEFRETLRQGRGLCFTKQFLLAFRENGEPSLQKAKAFTSA
jgi:hypothetical protein